MNKKYKSTINWKRYSIGQVLDEYEYKRIPHELKPSFILVENITPPAVVHELNDLDVLAEVASNFVNGPIEEPEDVQPEKIKKWKDRKNI